MQYCRSRPASRSDDKGGRQVAEQLDDVYADTLQQIARLRLIVGFLGEKGQHHWWESDFFSTTAAAFLSPVFNKTAKLAQYHGVKEAARWVHDEHIGVGRVFHLFRLPEAIEQALFDKIKSPMVIDALMKGIESPEVALSALDDMADSSGALREGPVQIGTTADLASADWIAQVAQCYGMAFHSASQSFPYLMDRA